MTTFALVHGAGHGAWCWERLLGPLQRRGHRAVAVDLPCEDLAAGLDAYADAVAASVADADEDVIVVGHSLSGLVAPLVAARRPVGAVVYLTAFVPVAGRSMTGTRRPQSRLSGDVPPERSPRTSCSRRPLSGLTSVSEPPPPAPTLRPCITAPELVGRRRLYRQRTDSRARAAGRLPRT